MNETLPRRQELLENENLSCREGEEKKKLSCREGKDRGKDYRGCRDGEERITKDEQQWKVNGK
jgi:hypothetical protein